MIVAGNSQTTGAATVGDNAAKMTIPKSVFGDVRFGRSGWRNMASSKPKTDGNNDEQK
jgi:hypothetical protein